MKKIDATTRPTNRRVLFFELRKLVHLVFTPVVACGMQLSVRCGLDKADGGVDPRYFFPLLFFCNKVDTTMDPKTETLST